MGETRAIGSVTSGRGLHSGLSSCPRLSSATASLERQKQTQRNAKANARKRKGERKAGVEAKMRGSLRYVAHGETVSGFGRNDVFYVLRERLI